MSSITSASPDRNAMPQRRTPAQTAVPATTFTPKEILGMLRRRMWMIIIITTLIIIASVGLWFVLLKLAPRYTSRGLIRCEPPIQTDMLSTQKIIPTPGLIELETRSRAQELRNESFLAEILGRRVVQESKWYKSFGNDIDDRFKGLKKRFGATPMRDTEFVMVSMTTASAKESKKILDDILRLFQQKTYGMTQTGLRSELAAQQEVRKDLNRRIGVKRRQLAEIRGRINEPGWETGTSQIILELAEWGHEKMRLQSILQQLGIQIANIQKESQESGYSSAVLAAVENDPQIQAFRNRLVLYQEERGSYLDKFGPEHDQVRQLDARVREIEKIMQRTQSELHNRYQSSQLAGLENSYQDTVEILTLAEKKIKALSTRQSDIDEKRQEVLVLNTEIEDMTKRSDQISALIGSTSASVENPNLAKIWSYGSVPIMVSFPQLAVFLPGGFVLGLLFSVGLAFLLEFLDDSIKSPIDVLRHLHVPMLGMIPEYDEEDSEEVDLARIAFTQSHSLLGESYRQLKTNLIFSAPSEELKTILVTAATAAGGTTTSIVNLGITLSHDNKRVLLIDGNFHRPGLAKIFPPENKQGLSSVLVGQIAASAVVLSTDIPGLDVMHCGVKPPNPGELLGGAAMKKLLDEMKKSYDFILIDGPPSLVVSDTRTLASLVDGVMIVILAGETSRGIAQRMIRELRSASSANIRILGILLNAVKARKGGYYRESFESYYDYVGGETVEKTETVS